MSPYLHSTKKDTPIVSLQRYPNLYLKLDTPKGSRGVYSTTPIPAGTILDTSPVLILSPSENKRHIEQTSLYHYTYNWPLRTKEAASIAVYQRSQHDTQINGSNSSGSHTTATSMTQALVLGLGSMFNHSRQNQNVGWTRDIEGQVIIYRALRDIAVGEELCISYGDHLTFVDVDEREPPNSGEVRNGNGVGEGEEEALLSIEL